MGGGCRTTTSSKVNMSTKLCLDLSKGHISHKPCCFLSPCRCLYMLEVFFFFFHWMFIPPKNCHCQMFWKLLGEPCYWLVSFCYCRECRQMRRKNRKSHDDRWNKWDCEVYNIWLTLSCDLYMSKITLKYQAR